jgi:L-amino acid N-acyltransferase YncA
MPVRAAAPADALSIASVQVESWRTAYRGRLPDDVLDGLSVERRVEAWSGVIAAREPASAVLLLEQDGVVEGFAHVGAARDSDVGPEVGEVSAIYLRPTIWHRGFGRELMAAALRHLAEAGFTSAILWVLDTNDRARRFYEAGGWWRDGTERTEQIAGARVDEVRYVYDVGSDGLT